MHVISTPFSWRSSHIATSSVFSSGPPTQRLRHLPLGSHLLRFLLASSRWDRVGWQLVLLNALNAYTPGLGFPRISHLICISIARLLPCSPRMKWIGQFISRSVVRLGMLHVRSTPWSVDIRRINVVIDALAGRTLDAMAVKWDSNTNTT